jgi:hypothetical protein
MRRHPSDLITISPTNLDRSGYFSDDLALDWPDAITDRAWLADRFAEGMQMRMLHGSPDGFVGFMSGRAIWRPILGAHSFLAIQSVRTGAMSGDPLTMSRLLGAVEDWARYYGYMGVVVLLDAMDAARSFHQRCLSGYCRFDQTAGGVWLLGKVLEGPVELPRLPQDWAERAAKMGPGLVIQTAAGCQAHTQLAHRLIRQARAHQIPARQDVLISALDVRARVVRPTGLFSVVLDGRLLPLRAFTEHWIWTEVQRRWSTVT